MDENNQEENSVPGEVARQKPVPKEKNAVTELFSWLLHILVTVAVILLLDTFVCKVASVNGSSMYPTLYDDDLLLVRTIAYSPRQGDIVVCKTDPYGALGGENIVKRCIAVAGQTVFVDYANNTVTVDGVVLQEDYLNTGEADVMADGLYENTTYVVPEGCIFVLGDNRNHSTDSRAGEVGMVPLEDVIGGMVLRIPTGQWLSGGQ